MKALTFSATKESRELAHKHAYKEWVISRFLHYIPDIDTFLDKIDRPPQKYIRVNALKTTKKELMNRLEERGFALEKSLIDDVVAVREGPHPIGATPEYLQGYYYIQDLSSCISVVALDPQENETILDMCAAPGGKTTYIAQKMNNTGLIVALESNSKRLNSLMFNLSRCGVINTCIYNLNALDARKLKLTYDRILLDAPCTCEGVIQKDVGRKTSHRPSDIEHCSKNQVRLLETAVKLARHDSIIVYSTCSFAPEENEMVVDRILKAYDLEIVPIDYGSEGLPEFGDLKFDVQVRKTRRFYPHIHNTLGFYIAKMKVK
jgi:NOL1/NOP2/sun family putative RNA methylase